MRLISMENYWKCWLTSITLFSVFISLFSLSLPLPPSLPAFLFLSSSLPAGLVVSWAQHPSGPIDGWPAGVVRPRCAIYTALFLFVSLLDHPSLPLSRYLIPQLVSVARLTAPQDKCSASFSSIPQTEGYAIRAHTHWGPIHTHFNTWCQIIQLAEKWESFARQ